MNQFLLFFFSLFFSSVCISAQETHSDSFQMPIYPSCNKIKDSKERLICFQKNITSIYTRYLEKYIYSFEYLNLPDSEAKIVLELSKEGRFNLKSIESNSAIFKTYAILAFEGFQEELRAKKIELVPAKTLDGKESIAMLISFPIGFDLTHKVEESFPRLISVLQDDENSYEVYLTPAKDFIVYQSGTINPIYLGKYSTLQEIKHTLPYEEILAEIPDLVTLRQADFGKVNVLLQALNIFDEANFYTLFIVSEVKGKKIKQLRKYNSFHEFKESPYYDWLIKK